MPAARDLVNQQVAPRTLVSVTRAQIPDEVDLAFPGDVLVI